MLEILLLSWFNPKSHISHPNQAPKILTNKTKIFKNNGKHTMLGVGKIIHLNILPPQTEQINSPDIPIIILSLESEIKLPPKEFLAPTTP